MRSEGCSSMMDEAVMPLGSDATPPSKLRFGFWSGPGAWVSLAAGDFCTKNSLKSLNLLLKEMSG